MTSGTIDRTFVDTNVLIYAHDIDAGRKHDIIRLSDIVSSDLDSAERTA